MFDFAASIRDWDSARKVLAGMRERFNAQGSGQEIQSASDWLDKRIGSSDRKGEESRQAG